MLLWNQEAPRAPIWLEMSTHEEEQRSTRLLSSLGSLELRGGSSLAAGVCVTGEGDSKRALEGCTWHCFRVQAGGRRGQREETWDAGEQLEGCLSPQHKGYCLQWSNGLGRAERWSLVILFLSFL